jgi:hypothetical protein
MEFLGFLCSPAILVDTGGQGKGESKDATMMMFLPMTQVPFMTDAFVEFRSLLKRVIDPTPHAAMGLSAHYLRAHFLNFPKTDHLAIKLID